MPSNYKINSATKSKIRRLIRIMNEQPNITLDELCRKFHVGVSSVSRLKRLAVDEGYATEEFIFKRKTQPTHVEVEAESMSVMPPAVGSVEVGSDEPEFASFSEVISPHVPSRPALILGNPMVVSLVLGKLSEIMRGNEPAINLWQHIRTIVDLEIFHLTQGKTR